MAITLSTTDGTNVRACSEELLSVLDDPTVEGWAHRVIERVRPLLGADRMFLALPTRDEFAMYHSDAEMIEAGLSYASYYHKTDVYVGPRRRGLGVDVYSFDMLISKSERNRSEFWNDWILQHKLCNPAGVSKDVDG